MNHQSLTTGFLLTSALEIDGTMPRNDPLYVFCCIIVIKISIYPLHRGSLHNAFDLHIFYTLILIIVICQRASAVVIKGFENDFSAWSGLANCNHKWLINRNWEESDGNRDAVAGNGLVSRMKRGTKVPGIEMDPDCWNIPGWDSSFGACHLSKSCWNLD